jgi:hypothetical protein
MSQIEEAEIFRLPGVADALRRAALRARLIAARTKTPLVISVDGQIQKREVNFCDLHLSTEEASDLLEDSRRC